MVVRVAEFYSGIGGMHFALKEAGIDCEVARAFDINTVANDVYRHNFPEVSVMQRSIESLPMSLFEALRSELWTMSPPCQPYTRQGLQKGSEDPRAKSFLFIIDLLAKLQRKPTYLLMENVAGFEKSDTRAILLRQLTRVGYRFEEYLLNPLQLCYPNSRTRYYLLAKLDTAPQNCADDAEFPPQFRHAVPGVSLIPPTAEPDGHVDFEKGVWHHDEVRQVREFMEDLTDEEAAPYRLSEKLLEKHGYVHDVVTPGDRRTCCFTKGYKHYAEGTGSILQLEGVVGQDAMTAGNTRYFTPREVANLMGFPASFTLPKNTSIKQGYRLLGNSLSVSVVSVLMDYLLHRM
ncbi:S-adenosyl-L-methionine-dependent methyltransferase [Martensiomyces pterosporus]|nr:S-adenosyl-L-methionine-dependent methyltransferase [Martensiomyces pterosporus]